MPDVVISIRTEAERAAREFSTLDRAVDRFGSSALAAGDRLQRLFTGLGSEARAARAELERTAQAAARLQSGGGGGGGGGFGSAGIGYLKANLVGYAAGEARELGGQVFQQQLDLSRANVALSQSAREAGVSIDSQRAAAKALSEQLNINIVDATALTAQTTRLTVAAGLGADKSDDLAKALANALAASGRSLEELPTRIQQVFSGDEEVFKAIGGVQIGGKLAASPEQIYKLTAAQQGLNRELTDTEKLQARINAVMQKGAETNGAAAAAVTTMAGQWEFFKRDVITGLSEAVDSYSRDFEKLTGFRIFGDVTDKAAEDLAKTKQFVKDLEDELARIDAFRARLGTGGFEGVGKPGGVVAAGASERVRGFDVTAREAADRAREREREFADRQRAERERALPERRAAAEREFEQARQSALGGAAAILALEERRAALAPSYRQTGFRRGVYGQETTEPEFGLSYGESEQDRVQRIFDSSGRYGAEFGKALTAYTESERQAQGGRFSRQLLLQGLSGVDPSSLTAQQRAAYDEALGKALEDQLKVQAEALNQAKRAADALDYLAGPNRTDPKGAPRQTIVVINEAPGTTARISEATRALAEGDTLYSPDAY